MSDIAPQPNFDSEQVRSAVADESAAWAERMREVGLPRFEGKIESPVIQQQPQTVANRPPTSPLLLPFGLIKWGADSITCVQSKLNGTIPTFTDAGAAPSTIGTVDTWIFTPVAAGVLYAHVTFDGSTGAITSRELEVGASTPADDLTNIYQQIGSWGYSSSKVTTVLNNCYGPLELYAEPPNPPSTGTAQLTSNTGVQAWTAIPDPWPCDGDGVHAVPCCGSTHDGEVPVCGGTFITPIPEHACASNLYLKSDGAGGISCGRAAATAATANTLVERDSEGGNVLFTSTTGDSVTGTSSHATSAGVKGVNSGSGTGIEGTGTIGGAFDGSDTGIIATGTSEHAIFGTNDAIIETDGSYKIAGTQIITTQQAAVADATGAGDVVAQLNALLARLRTHGLIAT